MESGRNVSQWKYLLSIGGGNSITPSTLNNDFVSNFLTSFDLAAAQYGFDGIDIDIESGMTAELLKAFRTINMNLHQKGKLVSIAPQPPNLNPGGSSTFTAELLNNHVPLVDANNIENVDFISIQMYNNEIPGDPGNQTQHQ